MRRAAVALFFAGCASVHPVEHDVRLVFHDATLEGQGRLTLQVDRQPLVLDAQVRSIDSVELDGAPVPFTFEGGHLTISTRRTGRQSLSIHWRVDAPGDPVWFGYSTPRWLPTVFDASARATLRLTIDAPDGWRAAASGTSRDGRTFVIDRPTAPFLFGLALGHLDVLEQGPLRVLGGTPESLARARRVVDFMTEKTGRPLPAPLTVAFVDRDAAQEAAGLVFIDRSAIGDPDAEWVFIHEIAHQWFGVALQCLDFDDFWLNEGFATFFVAAWLEALQGRQAYDAEVARWRSRSDKVHREGKDRPLSLAPPGQPRPHTPDAALQARGITYSRGALLLDALRRKLGDDTFWAVLRRYVADHAGKDVTSESFRASLEAVTQRSWADWFAACVYGIRCPELTGG